MAASSFYSGNLIIFLLLPCFLQLVFYRFLHWFQEQNIQSCTTSLHLTWLIFRGQKPFHGYTIAPYLTSIRWESLIFLLYMNSLLELRYCHQRFNFHLLLTHDVFSHRFQWNFFTKLNFFSLPRLYMQHILYIDLITSLHVLCKSWMSHNTLIRH